MITFGNEYQDKITDFRGTCTGFAQYMNGRELVQLTPKVDEYGKLREPEWFDKMNVVELSKRKAGI